ncbi:glycosyltransferase family 9 protein [Geomonas oryzisoli]|uniref:Glycosyltransferase family 9 protein n=1 Tax=Geomonas oryzisoli TaxID=2847992 RepID=A0ABX8J9S3_9BACT|nr:glycosyltransferase family 9 protein [Geomonas oryzisoli]QWV95073.1 glycosyltransferase family 9 protein [Geomonas oryzisoli]
MSRLRVLILRPDNIGDLVLFSGALPHIRELYPDAEITLAVQEHVTGLFLSCPFIDSCVPVGTLSWWGIPGPGGGRLQALVKAVIDGVNGVRNALRPPFDVVICPLKSPDRHHLELVALLHAPQRYGVAGCTLNLPQAGLPARLRPRTLFTRYYDVSQEDPWRHELQFNADFLRFVGCRDVAPHDIAPVLWLSERDSRHVPALRDPERKTVALFPGAAAKIRCWDAANYGELAGRLQLPVVYAIFGSPGDHGLAVEVETAIKARCPSATVVNLAGQTTLRELAACIGHCNLFIGSETSGLHMAIAAGVPSVGIVGGGHFGRFVPWGDPEQHIFLTTELQCFHCNWKCDRGGECIASVTATEVAQAATQLLQRPQECRS